MFISLPALAQALIRRCLTDNVAREFVSHITVV